MKTYIDWKDTKLPYEEEYWIRQIWKAKTNKPLDELCPSALLKTFMLILLLKAKCVCGHWSNINRRKAGVVFSADFWIITSQNSIINSEAVSVKCLQRISNL